MSTLNQKMQLIQAVKDIMGELGRLKGKADDIARAYAARGYDPAAGDPILLSALENYGTELFDLGTAINILQALVLLLNGQAHTTAASFPDVIAKWRQL